MQTGVLSQSEVDALLASLSSVEEKQPAATLVAQAKTVKLYNFRRPDKFSKEQVRSLQLLHEAMARSMSSTLSATLRGGVQMSLAAVEQGTYDNHTRQVPPGTIIAIIHMDPLSGRMLLEISPETGFMLVDRLLGGPGKPLAHTRTITDIEVALLKRLVTSLAEDIKAGWLNVVETSPRLDEIVLNTHLAQITFPTDAVMVITFEVKIGDTSGAMTFCLPYTTLEPITPQLNARLVFSEPTKAQRSDHAQAMRRSLQAVQVPVVAQLGTAVVHIRELLNLQVGDVLRLDSSVDGGVRLAVGGKPRFSGSPGLRGSRLVVQITAVIGDAPPQGE